MVVRWCRFWATLLLGFSGFILGALPEPVSSQSFWPERADRNGSEDERFVSQPLVRANGPVALWVAADFSRSLRVSSEDDGDEPSDPRSFGSGSRDHADSTSGEEDSEDEGDDGKEAQARPEEPGEDVEEEEEGEEAEEEEEAEVEESEETDSPVDFAVACMLIGSIGFVMIIFYLVHCPDEDIKRYSWSVVSCTISIFIAVLMFQAINGVIEYYVDGLREKDPFAKWSEEYFHIMVVVVDYLHFLVWFMVLQITIAIVSGAILEKAVDEEQIHSSQRQQKMKCWATLFAHMAGFASINAGGAVQHLAVFSASPAMALIPALTNWCFLIVVFNISDKVRFRVSNAGAFDERDEMWDEETEEAENDIASLSVSFLTVQALRFYLSGILPNQAGIEEDMHKHSFMCTVNLVLGSLVFAAISVFFVLLLMKYNERESLLRRVLLILQNMFAMCFAWCVLNAARWQIRRLPIPKGVEFEVNSIEANVLLALGVSGFAFMLIYFLDKIEDLSTSDSTDRAVIGVITALGILVGFSWEQSFDGGVEVLANLTSHPVMMKLVLGTALAMLVIPAWRMHILAQVLKLNQAAQQKKKLERAELLAKAPQQGKGGESKEVYKPVSQA